MFLLLDNYKMRYEYELCCLQVTYYESFDQPQQVWLQRDVNNGTWQQVQLSLPPLIRLINIDATSGMTCSKPTASKNESSFVAFVCYQSLLLVHVLQILTVVFLCKNIVVHVQENVC